MSQYVRHRADKASSRSPPWRSTWCRGRRNNLQLSSMPRQGAAHRGEAMALQASRLAVDSWPVVGDGELDLLGTDDHVQLSCVDLACLATLVRHSRAMRRSSWVSSSGTPDDFPAVL